MVRTDVFSVLAAAALLALAQRAPAQANVPVYTDNLVNNFQGNYSWATVNFANTSPVYSGSHSISVNATDYAALWLYHPDFNTAFYTNLNFWINGGSGGGQVVEVQGVQMQNGNGVGLGGYTLPALAKNTWQQYTIPLTALGVANLTNCNGFWFQIQETGTALTFFVDAIQLQPVPAPALTHIAINAAQPVRTADARWFGNNAAIWDSYFDTPETISQLNEAGWQILRYPGGSAADDYHWATDMTTDGQTWAIPFASFAPVATNIGAQVMITVNYGSGTPAEAVAWVANANVTNHYGVKYWELGNELYGTWETDDNTYPNNAYTYATRAQAYFQQMKAIDPTIKCGVDIINGEDSYANGYNSHPATNMTTHQVHYGWTPVLLSTLKSLGVTPDFASYHVYPQSGSDSDPFLLQGSNWAGDAANLRYMISNYFGAGGTNIELLCTENNSDSGPPGKQSVSLVNAIYYADNLGQLMQTEFNSYLWWDLRNGEETDGDLDPSIYGWRMYGDLGSMNGQATVLSARYPEFFSAKLMKNFARGGDTVVAATSTYNLLSSYAVHRTNGELTFLVINKDSASNFAAQIALGNFTPDSAAIYSYGMPQDNAAETGIGSCDIAQTNFTAATNFNYTFAPYSLTLFVFAPVAPSLAVLPVQPGSGQFVLQLGGQPGTPYVLKTSTHLPNWTPVSTNILVTSSLNITNTLPTGAGGQFWKAVWEP
jgi:alpha-N-arabinofuranosidase